MGQNLLFSWLYVLLIMPFTNRSSTPGVYPDDLGQWNVLVVSLLIACFNTLSHVITCHQISLKLLVRRRFLRYLNLKASQRWFIKGWLGTLFIPYVIRVLFLTICCAMMLVERYVGYLFDILFGCSFTSILLGIGFVHTVWVRRLLPKPHA